MKGAGLAGILLFILSGCASAPVIEKPLWERILDAVPWENRVAGTVEADENHLPDGLLRVMYGYGYRYVNSTHKIRQENGQAVGNSVYELKKENASYDPEDDTFLFIGEFYPDESSIWLIFSKDERYELYAGWDPDAKEDYRFIRISGTAE